MKKLFFFSMTAATLVVTTQSSSAYHRAGSARINANTLTCPWSMDWCFSDNNDFTTSFQSGNRYLINGPDGRFWAELTTMATDAELDDKNNPDYGGVIEFYITSAEEPGVSN